MNSKTLRSPRMLVAVWTAAIIAGCGKPSVVTRTSPVSQPATTTIPSSMSIEKITKTDSEWQKQLTPEQFRITRKKGTERAFTGPYWNNHEPGVYRCVACGLDLFSSDTKFDSGTGWPSFTSPIENHVSTEEDNTLFSRRTEVL